MNWAEAHIKALKLSIAEGCTFLQAAKVLSDVYNVTYSRSAIGGMCKRLGLQSNSAYVAEMAKRRTEKKEKPTPTQKPVQQAALEPPIPRHISIYELTDATCKWPFGDSAPFTYCGCQTFGGGPWCEPHDTISKSSGTRGEQMATRISTGAKHG